MGVVYVAWDLWWQEAVALKTFRDDVFEAAADVKGLFIRESKAWIDLDVHMNITQAKYVQEGEGKPLLCLEYVGGGDLSAWMGRPILLESRERVLGLAIQFCDGMIHAVSKGVLVHRDIKPQNCLLTKSGVLKVTDFGIAKILTSIGTGVDGVRNTQAEGVEMDPFRTGTGVGTPVYMAPEQFHDARHVDTRADIYSFGVVLFEMATGRPPFLGQTWDDYAFAHLEERVPDLGGDCRELTDVVQRCLNKAPDRRFADFTHLRMKLAEIYENEVQRPAPAPATGRALRAYELNNKGDSLLVLCLPEHAVRCFDQALELDPGLKEAWSNRGNALLMLGRTQEAIAHYDKALAIDAHWATAWCNKGKALFVNGQYQEALVCHDRAIALDAREPTYWRNMGLLLTVAKELEAALSHFDTALRLAPRDHEALRDKGVVLRHMSKHDEAIMCYEQAVDIEPNDASVWSEMGATLIEMGRCSEAVVCCEKAIAIDNKLASGWFLEGTALESMSRVHEAIKCYEVALRLGDPEAPEAIDRCHRILAQ